MPMGSRADTGGAKVELVPPAGTTNPAALDRAEAELARALEREAAVGSEGEAETEAADLALEAAQSRVEALARARARGEAVSAEEAAEARAEFDGAAAHRESLAEERRGFAAAAAGEVRHWRAVYLAALRDALRAKLAEVKAAADAAEQRVTRANADLNALTAAEVDGAHLLRGGFGMSPTAADLQAMLRRLDGVLASATAARG
jgi:hypothetical protein